MEFLNTYIYTYEINMYIWKFEYTYFNSHLLKILTEGENV